MDDKTKYKVEVSLTRLEYQVLCQALTRIEAQNEATWGEPYFALSTVTDKEKDNEIIQVVRMRIRRAFTLAFGQNRIAKDE